MATLPLSLVLATFFLQLFSGAPSSTFTIVNQCNYTVWPALASLPGAGKPSISTTGFILQPGESTSISVPTSWSGRLWGRTFCTEDPSGNFSCLTGDCSSWKLECSGFGATPVTLAEFTLSSGGGSDFYDVSFVDGYNLPMMISPHGGTDGSCISAGCAADLNGDCPPELKVVNGSEAVACMGACEAFKTAQYCCTGDHATPETCKPTSYAKFFKIACPTAYSYTFDDAIGTFTCTGADYSITFCPSTSASASNPEIYKNCRDALFECGNISVGYPFFGGSRRQECGHPDLELHCDYHNHTTTIEIDGVKHLVLDIRHENQTLTIVREDLFNNGFCKPQTPIQGSVIDSELFGLAPPPTGYTNVTLFYGCKSVVPSSLGIFPCNDSDYNNVSVTTDGTATGGCPAKLTFPISNPSGGRFHFRNDSNLLLSLGEAMKTGFQVKWKEDSEACRNCNASGGACGFNIYNSKTICLCPFPSSVENECRRLAPPPSQTYSGNNYTRGSNNSSSELHRNLIIGSTVGITVVATVFVCAFVLWFKRNSISNHFYRGKKDNATIEAFITNFGSFAPKQYSYRKIKKMTNKFSDKLGQGGFGSVYKGKLSDGRFVVVKILSESKGNGEDFMNEVTSISRTSHVNIVTLLGFCFERSKRALIYEFMAHGSLDKFIYTQGSDDRSRRLEWKTLYNIAFGIARGLEYLHQGCNTRILHFDIKPHNILLDENFCPKISDFGLSKLCKTKESVVSMTGARGTIGYIAPEVYCRNFGGVSYKSDVYSYGMLILEMVGGRKNINAEASRTSEVYFPTWIYKHLDQSLCSNLNGVIVEEEEEIARKLTIVSLWCIQNDPSDRPSMTKVLEMLQGSVQSLIIPSRPFVSSPVR